MGKHVIDNTRDHESNLFLVCDNTHGCFKSFVKLRLNQNRTKGTFTSALSYYFSLNLCTQSLMIYEREVTASARVYLNQNFKKSD